MIEKIKANISKILILGGFVFAFIFNTIQSTYGFSTRNNFLGFLYYFFFFTPIFIGLWLFSNNLKDKKKWLSIFIKFVILFFSCFLIIVSILVLVFGMANEHMYFE